MTQTSLISIYQAELTIKKLSIYWITILQVVNVKSLESTLVSNTPIYYSRVETKYPQFGFTGRRATRSHSVRMRGWKQVIIGWVPGQDI